jgi:hypothetical protein
MVFASLIGAGLLLAVSTLAEMDGGSSHGMGASVADDTLSAPVVHEEVEDRSAPRATVRREGSSKRASSAHRLRQ